MRAGTRVSTLDESAIVERVFRLISSVRGSKPDYTRLAAELAPTIPFDIFGVVLLRHDRQAVRVTVCWREEGNAWQAHYHQHPLSESRAEQVLRHPVMLIENYPQGADGPPAKVGDALSGHPQLRSAAIVPLAVEDRVLGTLELGSCKLGTYDDPSLRRLLEAVGRVLAAAIEGVQVGGSAQIQDRQREALKAVSNALASTMDLPTIFQRIVSGIAEALRVWSAIVTIDRPRECLRLEAQAGLEADTLARIIENGQPLSERCIIGFSLLHRQPQFSNDIGSDSRFPASQPLYSQLKIRSIFVHPLVTDSTVYGALLLCSEEPGGFTPLKVDILSLFASQATIAIHNGMLLEAVRRQQRFRETIARLEAIQRRRTDEEEERLLAQVRSEFERTFGISFISLLRFIADYLLTYPEQELQALMHTLCQRSQAGVSVSQELLHEQLTEVVPSRNPNAVLLTRSAEEALERASILSELSRLVQLHERLPGHLTDAWFAVDLSGRCIYMNPAAESLCGVRLQAGDSRRLEEVFSTLLALARNREQLEQYLSQLTQEQARAWELRCAFASEPPCEEGANRAAESAKGEHHERRGGAAANPDNTNLDRYYLFTRHPVMDQQGQLKAYALQAHDITEQVRDEKNKQALLSSVSHDLRTPLTSIKAAITGLLEPDIVWDEETLREILREVDAETDHLTVLINALIEMSRIEMGALTLEKEWCDMGELLNSALLRLERSVGRKHNIRLCLQPPLPLLAHVDYAQMERVFYNLLENALRHNGPNEEIIVELEIVDGILRGRILDRGYRLPEGERERIFKAFYSVDPQGNGLSLAICRGIIEAHRGRIWIESAPEGGANFAFTLPVCSCGPGPGSVQSLPSPAARWSEE
ncbi:MAG: GAF domain-containing protein [Thermogemmatispora sp.]|uniref:sensor histidine kinase n=1 Tax=Thermogemmatispora sp. TaxID=1968838 RepID=UPI001E0672A7|nr:GAF domain-containing protein [Thermogemmatispora sp.]MBX5449507.1 GAF domain-containing protein [Thermogemmatispora sp.]